MKKAINLLLIFILLAAVLTGCASGSSKTGDSKTLVVGASVTPHAEILQVCKEILAEKGIELKIVEFTDYVQPNLNVENGELDANYFQHKPYLDQFNIDHGTNLVSVAAIHYEPLEFTPVKPRPSRNFRMVLL